MRFLAWLLLMLLGLVALFAGVAYLLPREVEVIRTITVAAPPEVVFAQVNSLQRFAEWSPWNDVDPDLDPGFSGPEAGVGNRMDWSSEDPRVGSGSQLITLSRPNERVESALDFGDMGRGSAWFALDPVDEGTEVTWGLVADMGNTPLGRYMGLMMDQWVGADYEKGLVRLKRTVEPP